MLMVYSSKKGVTLWDHRIHSMHHSQFGTKAEMRERIALFNDFYNGSSSSSSSAAASSSSSAAASAADY
jgi:hypothetical protein